MAYSQAAVVPVCGSAYSATPAGAAMRMPGRDPATTRMPEARPWSQSEAVLQKWLSMVAGSCRPAAEGRGSAPEAAAGRRPRWRRRLRRPSAGPCGGSDRVMGGPPVDVGSARKARQVHDKCPLWPVPQPFCQSSRLPGVDQYWPEPLAPRPRRAGPAPHPPGRRRRARAGPAHPHRPGASRPRTLTRCDRTPSAARPPPPPRRRGTGGPPLPRAGPARRRGRARRVGQDHLRGAAGRGARRGAVLHLDDLATHEEPFAWTARLREQVLARSAGARRPATGPTTGTAAPSARPGRCRRPRWSCSKGWARAAARCGRYGPAAVDGGRRPDRARAGPGAGRGGKAAFWRGWVPAERRHFASDPSRPFADTLVRPGAAEPALLSGPGRDGRQHPSP